MVINPWSGISLDSAIDLPVSTGDQLRLDRFFEFLFSPPHLNDSFRFIFLQCLWILAQEKSRGDHD